MERLHVFHQGIGGFFKDPGYQIVFILIMAVERGPIDHSPFGNIAHRDGLEPFLGNQFNHRFLQEARCAECASRSVLRATSFPFCCIGNKPLVLMLARSVPPGYTFHCNKSLPLQQDVARRNRKKSVVTPLKPLRDIS
jgi:hypothetical protein